MRLAWTPRHTNLNIHNLHHTTPKMEWLLKPHSTPHMSCSYSIFRLTTVLKVHPSGLGLFSRMWTRRHPHQLHHQIGYLVLYSFITRATLFIDCLQLDSQRALMSIFSVELLINFITSGHITINTYASPN